MNQKPVKNIETIFAEDNRYPLEAVEFIREGLSFTIEMLRQENRSAEADYADYESESAKSTRKRHVSGRELCEGLRILAQKKWGFMARQVLNRWNIRDTRDFGEIVFLLVNHGWMQKQPHDSIEDFDNVYDFVAAFEKGYEIIVDE